ncbi:GumN family protein [Sulfuricurvum kujiense DSM 16994]|uniref:GumN family protein n=1 Tax=Sulfuricurvum kujiense (strain ATCC BAA-921 / DSM 16994 / JCM 11577 / YK-1) TaxID=709032 RepID=E4U310_SULKY|nr:TraB/GumN family protein [Sulfuricurvum kujiense]ADR33680.1 GumN family protein [Sulfuricurvum kujiense DSM 16994]
MMKVLIALIFLYVHLCAQSSVWKISDKDNHAIYIAGTIHVLRSGDFPLPKEFDEAYKRSEYVVFETDLALANSQTLQRTLAQKMMLPPNRNLSAVLSAKTYAKLKDYVNKQGYKIEMFDRMRPWAVILTLSQLKLSSIGIDQNGVDGYYNRRSLADRLPQRYLESIEEQSAIITEIGKGEEDAVILQTLRDMDAFPSMMEWMVKEWREGKTERLKRELVDEMRNSSPEMYRIILKQRNEAWMPKLIALLHEEKRGFVLVGAMHLLGRDGLLEQFRKQGYKVEYFEKGK